MKKTKFKWQMIYKSLDSYTERAKVIGGWLVNNFSKNVDRSSICESMCFVPDPDHKWLVDV